MKCSPGLAPALGGQRGRGCASGGLVKEPGIVSRWGMAQHGWRKKGWKLFLVGLAAGDWLWTSSGQCALKQAAVACWAGSQGPLCWTDRSGEELFLADRHGLPQAFPSLLNLPRLLSVLAALASIGYAVKLLITPSRVLSWILLGVECRKGECRIIFSFSPL